MNIEEKITYYKKSLDFFEDRMDKYKFLLEQGKKAKPFPEEYRQDNFKVSGCQSQVWLVTFFSNKLFTTLAAFLYWCNLQPFSNHFALALLFFYRRVLL